MEYLPYVQASIREKSDLLHFLGMVKLKQRKLKWAIKKKDRMGAKNRELAYVVGVSVRRFQQLYAEYRKTGRIPKLNPCRRPKREITNEEKELILKTMEESKLKGANMLELHIRKYHKVKISHNKIHGFLISQGIAREDPKKKKQRKYCRYERDHSFSLVHLDWHDSRILPGRSVCAVEDDASRKILAGGEFDASLANTSIALVQAAMKSAAEEYSAVIREVNTDMGTQFYSTKYDRDGEKGKNIFELFLADSGVNHIVSSRNHPQTNGKEERWFRTYEENRGQFASFGEFVAWYNDRIHLGLSRKEGITPDEAVVSRLQPESLVGLFCRMIEKNGGDSYAI